MKMTWEGTIVIFNVKYVFIFILLLEELCGSSGQMGIAVVGDSFGIFHFIIKYFAIFINNK